MEISARRPQTRNLNQMRNAGSTAFYSRYTTGLIQRFPVQVANKSSIITTHKQNYPFFLQIWLFISSKSRKMWTTNHAVNNIRRLRRTSSQHDRHLPQVQQNIPPASSEGTIMQTAPLSSTPVMFISTRNLFLFGRRRTQRAGGRA